jgi:hypothetical protein
MTAEVFCLVSLLRKTTGEILVPETSNTNLTTDLHEAHTVQNTNLVKIPNTYLKHFFDMKDMQYNAMKLTIHLHLVPRLKCMGLYLQSTIRLLEVALN